MTHKLWAVSYGSKLLIWSETFAYEFWDSVDVLLRNRKHRTRIFFRLHHFLLQFQKLIFFWQLLQRLYRLGLLRLWIQMVHLHWGIKRQIGLNRIQNSWVRTGPWIPSFDLRTFHGINWQSCVIKLQRFYIFHFFGGVVFRSLFLRIILYFFPLRLVIDDYFSTWFVTPFIWCNIIAVSSLNRQINAKLNKLSGTIDQRFKDRQRLRPFKFILRMKI